MVKCLHYEVIYGCKICSTSPCLYGEKTPSMAACITALINVLEALTFCCKEKKELSVCVLGIKFRANFKYLPSFFLPSSPFSSPHPFSLPPLFSSSLFKLSGPAASFVAALLAMKSVFDGNTMAACRAGPLYSNVTARHYCCISSSK